MRSEMFQKGMDLVNLVDVVVNHISGLATRAEQEDAMADLRTGLYPSYYPVADRVVESLVEWKE